MSKQPNSPIGFGRVPMPADAGQAPAPAEQAEPAPAPPLAEPVAVDELEELAFFSRYNLFPLTPTSKFEHQLVQIAVGLEQRIKELDPNL